MESQIVAARPTAHPTARPTARPIEPWSRLDGILDALRLAEVGDRSDGGRDATGDGGRAIGPFQIHLAYFVDAGIAGRYDQCRDPIFARRVVIAYWKRWCPGAFERCDPEVLARIHNGGPEGARKSSTWPFWRRVQGQLAGRSIPSCS